MKYDSMNIQLSDHRPVYMNINFNSEDKINLLSLTDSIDFVDEQSNVKSEVTELSNKEA